MPSGEVNKSIKEIAEKYNYNKVLNLVLEEQSEEDMSKEFVTRAYKGIFSIKAKLLVDEITKHFSSHTITLPESFKIKLQEIIMGKMKAAKNKKINEYNDKIEKGSAYILVSTQASHDKKFLQSIIEAATKAIKDSFSNIEIYNIQEMLDPSIAVAQETAKKVAMASEDEAAAAVSAEQYKNIEEDSAQLNKDEEAARKILETADESFWEVENDIVVPEYLLDDLYITKSYVSKFMSGKCGEEIDKNLRLDVGAIILAKVKYLEDNMKEPEKGRKGDKLYFMANSHRQRCTSSSDDELKKEVRQIMNRLVVYFNKCHPDYVLNSKPP